jgi:uncharacterized protein (TIGR02145 family)
MKKILLMLIGFVLFGSLLWAQEVTNVTASQRTDGSKLLDVFYDLAGTETQYTVNLEISFDDCQTFDPVAQVSGDVGNVAPATGLQIVWDAAAEFPDGFYSETMKVKVNAEAAAGWQCGDILVDTRDGQEYETVQIGQQCWMAENLNIGNRIDGVNEQTDNGIIEKYCYNNSETNCNTYGGLYQWDEMMNYTTTAGVQGICPDGWHLPTDGEWTALTNYVSSQPEYLCNSNTTYIAKDLAATTNWNTYSETCAVGNNLAANNATGFTALPGGFRYPDGSFYNVNDYGSWWSSPQGGASDSWNRDLRYYNAHVGWYNNGKLNGFSVRCLKY